MILSYARQPAPDLTLRLGDEPENSLPPITESPLSRAADCVQYIKRVKQELAEDKRVFSKAELKAMRTWLKSAYATCKSHYNSKEDVATLAEYRKMHLSCLGRMGQLEYQAQMTEGNTLERVLEDKDTDESQKLTLTKYWVRRNEYPRSYRFDNATERFEGLEESLTLANNTEIKISSLLDKKAQRGEALTKSEQRTYHWIMDELDAIRERVAIASTPITIPEKKPAASLEELMPPEPPQNLFQRAGSFVSSKFAVVAVTLGISLTIACSYWGMFNNLAPTAYVPPFPPRAQVAYTPPPLPSPKPVRAPAYLPQQHLALSADCWEMRPRDTVWKMAGWKLGDTDMTDALLKHNKIADPRRIPVSYVLDLNLGRTSATTPEERAVACKVPEASANPVKIK